VSNQSRLRQMAAKTRSVKPTNGNYKRLQLQKKETELGEFALWH
jgi:hypothetical protein